MSLRHKRLLNNLVTVLTLVTIIGGTFLPALSVTLASAQEVTPEPAPIETTPEPISAEGTPESTVPPAAATSTTVPETTEEPVAPVTTPAATEELTPLPPTLSFFEDNFQDGDYAGWYISADWQVSAEDGNLFLRSASPGQTATVADVRLQNLTFNARVRLGGTDTASIAVRADAERYTVLLTADGSAQLYRGTVLLAESVLPETTPEVPSAPTWFLVGIQASGANISVALNGTPVLTYSDPAPLGAGMVIFSTGAANTGSVDVDDVTISELPAEVAPPVVVTTEAPPPEPAPETTAEPTAEATAESEVTPEPAAPEATAEATAVAIAEPEMTAEPEATTEPEAADPQFTVLLEDDFEGDLSAWAASEGLALVETGDGNHAAALSAGTALAPAASLYTGETYLDARFTMRSAAQDSTPTGLSLTFRAMEGQYYTVSLETARVSLLREDGTGTVLLAEGALTLNTDTWYTLSLRAEGGHIVLLLDGTVVLEYVDEAPLPAGQISFAANPASDVWLDDVRIAEAAASEAAVATPLVNAIPEEQRGKVEDILFTLVNMYAVGDEAGALALAAEYGMLISEDGQRITVIVTPAEGYTPDQVVALIETTGGVVEGVFSTDIYAQMPLASFAALVNTAEVGFIRLPSIAVSTSAAFAPMAGTLEQPGTATTTEGFDIIGAYPWYNAGVRGAGVTVGIIDTSFGGSNHGQRVLEIVQDIAPNATFRTYAVSTPAQIATAITTAQSQGVNVLLIALDMGANVSFGDGTGNSAADGADAVYANLQTARNAGMVIIVSAGNNANRYASFSSAGSVTVQAGNGDQLLVRWSSGSAPVGGLTPTGTNGGRLTLSGNTTINVNPNGGGIAQVQVIDAGSNSVAAQFTATSGNLTTTGTLARPADSPDVIAVGAVCASYDANDWDETDNSFNSSYGPVFAVGGTDPGVLTPPLPRSLKPEVVGPSGVSVTGLARTGACDETDGFNGTSASAAHVAGMAALLIANPNTTLDAFNNGATDRPAAVEAYLQMHASELPLGALADGFDRQYGAGLAILGEVNPAQTYNSSGGYTLIVGPITAGGDCAANILYVGKNNPDSQLLGTFSDPYIHPAQALALAGTGDCVVLLPGTYTDVIVIPDSFPDNITLRAQSNARSTSNALRYSTFLVTSGYGGTAITLENDLTTISGFRFLPQTPLNVSFPLNAAVVLDGAVGSAFSNSVLGYEQVSTPGGLTSLWCDGVGVINCWRRAPIEVVNGSHSAEVRNNLIQNVYAIGGFVTGIVVDSSGDGAGHSNPVLVELNYIRRTIGVGIPGDPTYTAWSPMIRAIDSGVNIYSNTFAYNLSQTMVQLVTPSTSYETRVAGNMFFFNTIRANGTVGGSSSGPLVHLDSAPRTSFINNSIIGNVMPTVSPATVILGRGDANLSVQTPGPYGANTWEIHNNFIYINKLSESTGIAANFEGDFGCVGYDADAAIVRNNWVDNTGVAPIGITALGALQNPVDIAFGAVDGDECITPYNNGAGGGGNFSSAVNPAAHFAGQVLALQPIEPLFYRPNDQSGAVPPGPISPAVNAGYQAEAVIMWPDLATAPDAGSSARYVPLNTGPIDIGAHEVATLDGNPLNVTVLEDNGTSDSQIFTIDIVAGPQEGVDGGFPAYEIERVDIPPEVYGTTCPGDGWVNGIKFSGETLEYCAPRHFYTDATIPDVYFEITVGDQTPLSVSIPVTVIIQPTNDPPLATTVFDRYPAQVGQTVTIQLRPAVNITPTSFQFIAGGEDDEGDYPFTYLNPTIVSCPGGNDCNPNLFSQTDLNNAFSGLTADGVIQLTLAGNEDGYLDFTYQVRDTNNSTITNTVRVRAVSPLTAATEGLHDDTSLVFTYHGAVGLTTVGGWIPVYNETSINNTLHQTSVLNDAAEFQMVGDGFVLYMQGSARGGNYDLLIDKNSDGGFESFTIACPSYRTAATIVDAPQGILSNIERSNRVYTVSCTGLGDGRHTIRITNLTDRIVLAIDAIGVLNEQVALTPGFHEVNELEVYNGFLGSAFVETADRLASNGVSMTTTTTESVSFRFQGSGVAIGTVQEGIYNASLRQWRGASYQICVNPAGAVPETCQSFDNSVGFAGRAAYNVFRPFMGLDPNGEHEVTISVTDIPTYSTLKARFTIDSIVVFGPQYVPMDADPADPDLDGLPFGIIEDDRRGLLVFGNGLDDSWSFDTNNTRVSNSSLSSIARGITAAGPFVTFRIPGDANAIHWRRYANTRADSQNVMVCVGRAEGAAACEQYDLRTAPNPLLILESEFDTAWGAGAAHTVEIFSLTNLQFNVDSLQVFNTAAPFTPGVYEHTTPGQITLNLTEGTTTETDLTHPTLYSGGSVYQAYDNGETMLFRFDGTGFQARFVLERTASTVQICWAEGNLADPAAVDAAVAADNGTCVDYDNYFASVDYNGLRTIAGLEEGIYTAYIRHTGVTYNPSTRVGEIMKLDTITVLGDDWTGLNPLTDVGVRYETSYTNRLTQNSFLYYGTAWRSFTGTAARLQSGSSYDQIMRATGAGIIFQTDNADIVRLYRDTRVGYAALLACAAPLVGGTLDYANYTCTVIQNNGGTGNQQVFNIPLSGSGPHVVSIMTLDNLTFNLDAIELVNSVASLAPGTYSESHPGLTYDYETPPTSPTTVWRTVVLASRYVDNSAFESTAPGARLTFSCTQCTGFTLYTLMDRSSGQLLVDVTGGSVTLNDYVLTAYNLSSFYGTLGARVNLTDLPLGNYTFTITEADPTTNKFVVDSLVVHGDERIVTLNPSLVDNAARNANNDLVLTFGPESTDWIFNQGRTAPTSLYQTSANTVRFGSTIKFEVENTNAITLYFDTRTSTTALRVCAVPASGAINNTNYRCTTVDVFTQYVRNRQYTFTLSTEIFPAFGAYNVSITNLGYARAFNLDAIGIHDLSGSLQPGLYQDNHPQLVNGFNNGTGAWTSSPEATATDGNVRSGTAGSYLEFTFEGTGFAIVLSESTLTSGSYRLCYQAGAGPCNSTSETLPDAGLLAARNTPVAITRVGFASGTYTVRITNLDASKPLRVDRVDILGDVPEIDGTETGNIENTDSRLVYFPYGSFTQFDSTLASSGSEHRSTMRGAIAYFEVNSFSGNVSYNRYTLASFGDADVCYGAIGDGPCIPSTPPPPNLITIDNRTPSNAWQQGANIGPLGGTNNYVYIENQDGLTLPLDFLRLTNPSQALTPGTYDNTFSTATDRLEFDGSFDVTPLVQPLAFGGGVQNTNVANSVMVGVFEGTGISVLFTFDRYAGPVEICWDAGAGNFVPGDVATTVTNVEGSGTCQEFNNYSAATRYKAARTIVGLANNTYTFFVRHTGTDYDPVTRTGNTMQIDAVTVYGEIATTALTSVIDPGDGRVETSYDARFAQNTFFYYGSAWRSFSGTRYRSYSGQNYDQSLNIIGASVVFRTSGANSLMIYRDIRAGYAPMLVCAAPESNLNDRVCTLVNNAQGTGIQQPVSVPLNGSGAQVVSITTMDFGTLNLDAVEAIDASGALTEPGIYEDVDPRLTFTNADPNTPWQYVYNTRSYSAGRARQSTVNGDTLEFSFTGTGFAIGTVQDVFGGEMEVCYGTDTTWGNGDDRCYTYQNESRIANYNTVRTVTGLGSGTYYVRARNVEDGNSQLTNPPTPRTTRNPNRMIVDYVQVFTDAAPPVVAEAGWYGETATDGTNRYLQLLPANRWTTFEGSRFARGYTNLSYVSSSDTAGRASNLYPGAPATLRIQIPANTAATFVLFTGTGTTANSNQLLVCADSVQTSSCAPVTNEMTLANQVVIDSTDLPALNNATGAPVTLTLTIRTLTQGFFRIDGFQVIHGTALPQGVNDNFLPDSMLNFSPDVDSVLVSGRCSTAGGWCTLKTATAYGGSLVQTSNIGATLEFTISGTGFSVITQNDRLSTQMRLCYKPAGAGAFPDINGAGGDQAVCQTFLPETRFTYYQYGFTMLGLPDASYDVQVMNLGAVNPAFTTYMLKIDAVAVFGPSSATVMEPGTIYDDTATDAILYAPSVMWTPTTGRFGPPRGPINTTETTATTAGSIVQLNVDGNAMILYQTVDARSSSNVRICVVDTNATPGPNENVNTYCSEFSQNSRRAGYGSPILFYGFGSGTHEVILENRSHNQTFRIDAIQVIP